MSKPLFPPEILEFSAETYYAKYNNQSRIIYLSVLIFIVAAIILLPVIKVDVTTQSRGVVRSSLENTIIQSSVYGEIGFYNISENKPVNGGDTLLVINTAQLDEKIELETMRKSENELFVRDISVLLNGGAEMLTPKYRLENRRYRSSLEENKIRIDFLKREFEVARELYSKSVIPRSEYLKEENAFEMAVLSNARMQEEYKTSWQNEQTRLKLENMSIESAIRQLGKEKNNYVLTAPVSGTLTQVAGFQPGNFIVPNQMIATISASDSLLVECYLSPFDIGYIKENQEISCRIDAFDFRYWGSVQGRVTEILNDVVEISGSPMFRVRCEIESDCLRLKNGYEGCVKKGMTLTCRFHLSRRSLWHLLFEKIDDWMNPEILTEK